MPSEIPQINILKLVQQVVMTANSVWNNSGCYNKAFIAASGGGYGRSSDVSVLVLCDAIKAAFRFQLFIFSIYIPKHNLASWKQSRSCNNTRG